MEQDTKSFDAKVRAHVYELTLRRGVPPTSTEVAHTLATSRDDVVAAFSRLALAHVLVLQPDTGEILMANPFSSVPTPFRVETEEWSAYGNCIWDALGIPAMLQQDARIITSCGDCGTSAEVNVAAGRVDGEGVLHFAIPAREWWNDIVFT